MWTLMPQGQVLQVARASKVAHTFVTEFVTFVFKKLFV